MKALIACALIVLAASRPAAATQIEDQSRALNRASDAVVGLHVSVLEDARSIATLGAERQGSGVVIEADGLVLTIGYLILEADQVQIITDDGRELPARVVAYDVATGFGLVQALAPLRLEPVPLGQASALLPDEPLMVASGGEEGAVSVARVVSQRPFSGFWEYHIDSALFVAPARRDHSGAALFNGRGELVGIGSLFVADALGPWLGLNCVETDTGLRVLRVTADSPADVAGLEPGDRIERIDGADVKSLAMLWKTLWAGGLPEREVRLDIVRDGERQTLKVQSVDRMKTLKRAEGI
jgi:serine protease Do